MYRKDRSDSFYIMRIQIIHALNIGKQQIVDVTIALPAVMLVVIQISCVLNQVKDF